MYICSPGEGRSQHMVFSPQQTQLYGGLQDQKPPQRKCHHEAGGDQPQILGPSQNQLVRIQVFLLAIILNAGGPQPGQAVAVDRALPAQIFLNGKDISVASLFQTQ